MYRQIQWAPSQRPTRHGISRNDGNRLTTQYTNNGLRSATAPASGRCGDASLNAVQAQRPARHASSCVVRVSAPEAPVGEKELGIYSVDPELRKHSDHLDYRWKQYKSTKDAICAASGSLTEFAKGYERFGFTREDASIVYREWAPAAQAAALIGDFNGWEPSWMTRDEWGVWSVTLPDVDGKPAIPHGSKVKVRLQSFQGWWVDRLPAWVRRATVPPGVMGAKFDGIYWDPPPGEAHVWRHSRPPLPPTSLRIYEAHVGMGGEEARVATYTEFKTDVLPRIKAQGYNAIQLMAIQEHAYYASFGYHVTNPFAVSSRSGTPEELKALIDEAHGMGIIMLLDVVHSHISKNADDGLAGFDFGQGEDTSYFRAGPAGYHTQWDSKVLNYKSWEVQRYLLSNLRYWLDEFKFDGFRFDGVTSMLYHHHGINTGFSGGYHEYFGPQADVDAAVYMMLANEMVHQLLPGAVTIAEDVSGMPGLCRPVSEGGLGFDYRLNMAVPDKWIQLLKHVRDEHWSMADVINALCNRRYTEKTVAYAESHDQAMVGDKTIAMWLLDAEIYTGMSSLNEITPVVERGIALHKLIRSVTMALGGEAWLNFMGNEFGHPEWLDFPREGNEWSHQHARRQWSLADKDHLRYKDLLAWDQALQEADVKYGFLSNPRQWVTHIDQELQVIVAERGPLLFVFNFNPTNDYDGLKVAVPEPGKYRIALDSDAFCFGGKGRVAWDVDHFSTPADEKGGFHGRDQFIQVMSPSRTATAYYKVDEDQEARSQQQPQRQQQPWEQEHQQNGNGNGNGNGGDETPLAGRFASYLRQRQDSDGGSNGMAHASAAGGEAQSESEGRFAAYLRRRGLEGASDGSALPARDAAEEYSQASSSNRRFANYF